MRWAFQWNAVFFFTGICGITGAFEWNVPHVPEAGASHDGHEEDEEDKVETLKYWWPEQRWERCVGWAFQWNAAFFFTGICGITGVFEWNVPLVPKEGASHNGRRGREEERTVDSDFVIFDGTGKGHAEK